MSGPNAYKGEKRPWLLPSDKEDDETISGESAGILGANWPGLSEIEGSAGENIVGFEDSWQNIDESSPTRKETLDPSNGQEHNTDLVRIYLEDMGSVMLLTKEGEVNLARRMEKGKKALFKGLIRTPFFLEELENIENSIEPDQTSLREIFNVTEDEIEGGKIGPKLKALTANLRLVVSIAKKYQNRGLAFLDLIQEGNIGLMRAVDKFNYRLGHKFSTYATWWIRQAITRAIADQSRTIRIPVHMTETRQKLTKATQAFVKKNGREPSVEEIAKLSGLSLKKVREILRNAQETMSIETPIGENGESALSDFIEDKSAPSPPDTVIHNSLKEQIEEALKNLSDREAEVIRLRFGLDENGDHTLEEVGEHLRVTRERIRQIESKALRKLQEPDLSSKLRTFA